MKAKKILHVVGARPNFMKIAPIMKEMSKFPGKFTQVLVHTGQHYDHDMSKSFFNDLGLPKPDILLGENSGTHAEQTANIMIQFEKVCIKENPDLVVVVGDVNSTVAAALVASKLNIPIAHVEAGLRSFDRSMPEEINRMLTDQVSDFLFTTCEDANKNLLNEGIASKKIFFVGNVMIDSLIEHLKLAKNSRILEDLKLIKQNKIKKYAVVTLHRPSNVDNSKKLEDILFTLKNLSEEIMIVFPVHPRTVKQIKNFKLEKLIYGNKNFQVIPPLSYIDFLKLTAKSILVLTDSGGIQEETTILQVPCLTLRENTERPITVKIGSNRIVGANSTCILEEFKQIMTTGDIRCGIPEAWDGKAAARIVEIFGSIE